MRKRSMVAALAVGASVMSFGLTPSVAATVEATPRPLYGVAEGARVTMLDGKFDPSAVTIKAGEAVTWKNGGQQTHTATADDGSFNSGDVPPGLEWSHPFMKAGTFTYKCTKDPNMKGTVNVVQPPPK